MDTRTLVLADALVQICCALGLLLMSRSVAGLKGLRWFAWAYVTATVGLALVLLHPAALALPAQWSGRLLVVGAAVLMSQGIAEFSAPRSSTLGWGAGLMVVFATVEIYALWTHSPMADLAFAAAFGAQLLVCVFVLMAHREAGERAASRTMAVLLAVIGCLCLARALWPWLSPQLGAAAAWLSPARLSIGGALLYLLFTASMAFGFVWMMTARLRNQLERQARTDALTGVLNRRALESTAVRELAACHRRLAPLAVLAIDLDHFKFLNDAYGHAAGDAALSAAASLLMQCLRSTDLLARFGGEEFVAVLPDRDGVRASLIAERLRSRLEALRVDYEGQQLALTASFGIAVAGAGDSWSLLLRRADRALYVAKRAGRNCIRGESDIPMRSSTTTRPSSRSGMAKARA